MFSSATIPLNAGKEEERKEGREGGEKQGGLDRENVS